MDRLSLPLLSSLLVLAACGPGPASRDAQPEAGPLAAPGAVASSPGDEALPRHFIVSTNEPFWQARVEDGEVVLHGPDVQGRRFAIPAGGEANGPDARTVHASDGAGTIVAMVLPGPCVDSMSGATFPFAGELTIDGIGPHAGCARPAGMPPPPGPGT